MRLAWACLCPRVHSATDIRHTIKAHHLLPRHQVLHPFANGAGARPYTICSQGPRGWRYPPLPAALWQRRGWRLCLSLGCQQARRKQVHARGDVLNMVPGLGCVARGDVFGVLLSLKILSAACTEVVREVL